MTRRTHGDGIDPKLALRRQAVITPAERIRAWLSGREWGFAPQRLVGEKANSGQPTTRPLRLPKRVGGKNRPVHEQGGESRWERLQRFWLPTMVAST